MNIQEGQALTAASKTAPRGAQALDYKRVWHCIREAGAGSSNLLTPTNYFLINQVLNNPTEPCWGYLKSACHTFVTLVSDVRMRRWHLLGNAEQADGRHRSAEKATRHNPNPSLPKRQLSNGFEP